MLNKQINIGFFELSKYPGASQPHTRARSPARMLLLLVCPFVHRHRSIVVVVCILSVVFVAAAVDISSNPQQEGGKQKKGKQNK